MYNLFELVMPKIEFDINEPIKLFEAFSGIGTQAMALKKLGFQINHIGISDTQLYKQAGNAIVVDVLYHIFKNLIKK